ncbi:25181_t:CDS:1, partial [Gigaspora rosea]
MTETSDVKTPMIIDIIDMGDNSISYQIVVIKRRSSIKNFMEHILLNFKSGPGNEQ